MHGLPHVVIWVFWFLLCLTLIYYYDRSFAQFEFWREKFKFRKLVSYVVNQSKAEKESENSNHDMGKAVHIELLVVFRSFCSNLVIHKVWADFELSFLRKLWMNLVHNSVLENFEVIFILERSISITDYVRNINGSRRPLSKNSGPIELGAFYPWLGELQKWNFWWV